ncbi:MAG: UbiA family prenyltransferase [Myxococcota bacterium]|nr:UbiA family prenyltransferase [Myxococcota bacterium]
MSSSLPLCIDLDGTLVMTDTLHESFVSALRNHPLQALMAFAALPRGRSAFKARVAAIGPVDASALPYRPEVLEYAREARAQGRAVVLATATDGRIARAVAEHQAGLFDEVLASDENGNLKGAAKRQGLEARFGAGGYEYLGDSAADVPVWAGAGAASCVGARAASLARERAGTTIVREFEAPSSGLRTWISALRVHQWLKNVLVFMTVLLGQLQDPVLWGRGLVAFFSFSLCASAIYLINDLVDLEDDRAHPTKSKRALASGRLPIVAGLLAIPPLLAIAFGMAVILLPPAFSGVLLLYVVTTSAYSNYLKRIAMADVVILALLYCIRILAGAAATGVGTSPWLVGFSLFFFMSLAFLKRYADLRILAAAGGGKDRAPGRDYDLDDAPLLLSLGPASGVMATLIVPLYLESAKVADLYSEPLLLWGLVPLLVFWISRAWRIAHQGRMEEDPVLWTVRDRVSWGVGAAAALLLAAANFFP